MDRASGNNTPEKLERSLYSRWLVWLLSKWWWLFALLVGGLVLNCLLLPLAKGLDNWWPRVQSQVAEVLALRTTQPFLAGMVVIGVPVLTVLGYLAHQAIKREEQRSLEEKQRRIAEEAARRQVGELAETLKQPPAKPIQAQHAKETLSNVNAPSGLPRAAAFVGRAETLAGLIADLRQGGAIGVFALAGMGGVGKTALAAEAVAQLSEEKQTFPAGAVWIGCEDLRGPEGLAEAWNRVARTLDVSEIADRPDAEQRRAALHALLGQGQQRLLALDNVDYLEAAPLLETLAIHGHTTLLLTARVAIDLPGLTSRSLDTLPDDEAQALFAQTLARSSRAPRPMPEDEVALPELVVDLGGLPLALELTATYAGRQGLALATVRQEIAHDGVQAAPFMPAQHQAQRALVLRFDRSWQALAETPHRQRLFAALSLLKGDSFPRAAALALAMASGRKRATPANAPGDLAALVDYALVEALSGERLRLHPLLRDYAGKRLSTIHTAARDRLGEAMVTYWLAYAQAHPGYKGMDKLEDEAAGLMGAVTLAYQQARSREVLGLAHALSDFLFVRWRMDEALLVRPWALAAAQTLNDTSEEQWATHELAVLNDRTGRLAEARAGYERALELAQQLKDLRAEQRAVNALAVLDQQRAPRSEARAGFERALALARQLGDQGAELQAVHELAVLDWRMGRLAEARAGYEQALALAQQLKDLRVEQRAVLELARLDTEEQQLIKARAGYEHALALAHQLGDPGAERRAFHGLARLDFIAGRVPEARAGYERMLELARQLGDRIGEVTELLSLGELLSQHGEPGQGRKVLTEALTISEHLRDLYYIGKAHQLLGQLDREEGNRAGAISHCREALRGFEAIQSPDAEQIRVELLKMDEQI